MLALSRHTIKYDEHHHFYVFINIDRITAWHWGFYQNFQFLPHTLPKISGQAQMPRPCSTPSQSSSLHSEKETTAKENPTAWLFSQREKLKM